MSENTTKTKSKTDWERIANMQDKDIDTSDIPALGDDFFNNASLRLPGKKSITIRLDTDVYEWFKGQGKGYQTKINALLRTFMESQKNKDTTL